MADNFGAKPLLEEDKPKKKQEGEEFGAKPIEPIDESWGRFFLRKARGLAAGAAGLPGDIEELIRNDPLKLQNMFLNDEEIANNPDIPKEDEDRYLYSTGDIKNSIDKKAKEYGYDLKPRGFWEHAEDAGLEFAGAGGTLGAITKGYQGVKTAFKLPELVSSGAMGVVHQGAEELELPAWAKIPLVVATGRKAQKAAPGSVKEAISTTKKAAEATKQAVKSPVKTGKEFIAKQVAKRGKFKEEVVDAAKRRGIDPLLSNVIESRGIQNLESTLKESALTGPHYENKLNQINEQTKEAFNRVLENVSPDARTGRIKGEDAIQRFKDNITESQQEYKALYEASNKAIPKDATTTYAETRSSIKSLKDVFNKTALVKGERSQALSVLNEMESKLNKEAYDNIVKDRLNKIVDKSGKKVKPTPNQRERIEKEAEELVKQGKGEVSPSTLLGTEDALNDYIDWHAQGGNKKALKRVVQSTKADIEGYITQKNPSFGKLYKEADKKFADYAKRLRNDLVKSILRREVPEEILSKMNNVSNVRKVEKALAQNPEGRKIMQGLKRAKLEEMLEGKMLNSEGQVKHLTFANALKDPKNQDLLQELVGKNNYRRLKDMQKYSSDLATASAKFANPSRSATKGLDIGIAGTVAAQVLKAFSTGNPAVIATTLAKAGIELSIPRLMSKLLTDKEFVELTAQAARNAKNPKAFKVFHDKLAQRVLKILAKEDQEQSKQK